jgi:hypothetical protein
MRILIALALFLYPLAGFADGDWPAIHQKGKQAFSRSDYSGAASTFEFCWPLAQTALEQAITANDLGLSLHALGREQEARDWLRRAYDLWAAMPSRALDLAETALGLVNVSRALGDFSGAEQILRRILAVLFDDAEHRAALLNTLGDMLREQERNNEADGQFREAIALKGISRERQLEATLGLADLARKAGNRAESEMLWNRAALLARETRSIKLEAVALRGLGLTRSDGGDYPTAESLLRRSLAMLEPYAGEDPEQVASALGCLAGLYRRQKKLSLAEEALLRAIDLDRKNAGEEHPQTALLRELLAELYSAEKRFDDAEENAAKAYVSMRKSFGENSVAAAAALATAALVNYREKRLETAAEQYSSALSTIRANNAVMNAPTAEIASNYAAVLSALHRNGEARRIQAELKSFGWK